MAVQSGILILRKNTNCKSMKPKTLREHKAKRIKINGQLSAMMIWTCNFDDTSMLYIHNFDGNTSSKIEEMFRG